MFAFAQQAHDISAEDHILLGLGQGQQPYLVEFETGMQPRPVGSEDHPVRAGPLYRFDGGGLKSRLNFDFQYRRRAA